VEYAIQIIFLHVTWLYKHLLAEDPDSDKVDALVEKRNKAKDVYHKLALMARTNSAEAVRKQVSRETRPLLTSGIHRIPQPPHAVCEKKRIAAFGSQGATSRS
jgi:hypothetical protein